MALKSVDISCLDENNTTYFELVDYSVFRGVIQRTNYHYRSCKLFSICFPYLYNTHNTKYISKCALIRPVPADIHLFKVNDQSDRAMGKICSKLTIKTPKRRQWRRSGVFIVNFEQISHIVLGFPLLTLNKAMPAGEHMDQIKSRILMYFALWRRQVMI